MNKLLSAELYRLFKSRIYKICLAFSIVLGIFLVVMRWYDSFINAAIYAKLDETYNNIDSLLFASPLYLIFAIGAFVGIFVGTEYSDGTIRNKITVGHLRSSIYLSKFIVCSLASVTFMFTNLATIWLLGNHLVADTTFTSAQSLAFVTVIFFATLGITAILFLIAMSVQSKSIGSVSCVLLIIVMMFTTIYIFSRIAAPEYIESAENVITNSDTNEVEIIYEKEKNPRYITGMKRQIYSTLNDILPFSQIYRLGMDEFEHSKPSIVSDCLIILLTTGSGIMILRKKDLK